MKHRSGTTLIEVLVAMFVSSIGLLALFALFPVGALSMLQAIKDNRCAQAAYNANAIAEVQQVRQDPALFPPSFSSSPYGGDAFTNPSIFMPPANTALMPALTWPYDGPSYPVYIDPVGTNIIGGTALGQTTVGGTPTNVNRPVVGYYPGGPASSPGFLRLTPSFAGSTQQNLRWFSLLDDIAFLDSNGTPSMPGGLVEREGRYSWGYLLRRPRYSDPTVVDLTVVVYSGRSTVVSGESTYYLDWVAGNNSVKVYWQPGIGQDRPPVRQGGWVLDATVVSANPGPPPSVTPDPHGYFYRVVGVTESYDPYVNQPYLTLEFQTNVRKGSAGGGQGVIVFMDNVAEVFEKGPGRLP